MNVLAIGLVVSACFLLPSGARAQNAATYVPPPGTTKAPGIKFEQDGDVRAGSLGLAGTANLPLDWAAADGGPGVIDLTTFIPNPLTPNQPTHKLILSLTHAALLSRDPNAGGGADPLVGIGADSTLFQGGSPQNGQMIGAGQSPWNWSAAQSVPARYDLTNCYLHTRKDSCGHVWLLWGSEIRQFSNDFHWDLELNHAGISLVQTGGIGTLTEGDDSGQLVGNGSQGGRTVGDVIISADAPQGGPADMSVHVWTELSPGFFDWLVVLPPGFDCDGNPLTTGDQDFDGVAGQDTTVYGRVVFGGGIPGGFWKHFDSDGATTDNITGSTLVESAVDLTALGVSFDPCSTAGTAVFKSRTSSSFNGALKDFSLVPFRTSPWTNVGNGLAGTQGVPLLGGSGCLAPATTAVLSLVQARPGAAASLILGLSAINAPFKGGVMVPNPDFIITGLVTSPAGSITLSNSWPASVPSGLTVFHQYWISDPVGPAGFAASNGAAATKP